MLYNTSIKFPYLFNGDTQLDVNFDSINRSISLILLTGKGELFGNPNYGSDIKRYQFMEITPEIKNLLADEIVNSIRQFENRVEITNNDIIIKQINDKLSINIKYSLKNSNVQGTTDVLVPIPTPKEV